MGPLIEIKAIEAIHCGTVLQVDTSEGRMFLSTREVLRALNNGMQEEWASQLDKQGQLGTKGKEMMLKDALL